MRMILLLHILAGGLGLTSGYVALSAAKGAALHRKSGIGRGRVPEVIRTPALLAAGVLLPILSMVYWLWRVRSIRTFRGIAGVSVPQAV